jgi:hypothetical protein
MSDDTGVVPGLGRSRGDTVHIVENDGETRLRWSGYLAEPVEPVQDSASAESDPNASRRVLGVLTRATFPGKAIRT